jgi:amino acid permease
VKVALGAGSVFVAVKVGEGGMGVFVAVSVGVYVAVYVGVYVEVYVTLGTKGVLVGVYV